MNYELIIIFAVLSIANVIFSTIKSIVTIKGDKWLASIISATYFSFYNIVLIYTVADFDLWIKCGITFGANLLGVFIVKFIEEKLQKDKLWVFNATVKNDDENLKAIVKMLTVKNIKCLYNEVVKDELYTMQIFSNTQKESTMIKSILDNFNVKYYAIETEKI